MLQQQVRSHAPGFFLQLKPRRSDLLLPAFVLLHAIAMAVFPTDAKLWSYAFLIAAPLLAAIACLNRARHSGQSEGWLECALAALLWAGGMAAAAATDVLAHSVGDATALSMLLYVLYGVPLIFALASPEYELWSARLVDGAMALALGLLFFIQAFTFTLAEAGAQGFLNLRLMFDIENGFIALFALIRFLASSDGSRRVLFGSIALFSGTYLATASYINHFQSESDFGHLVDLLITLPFLLLAVQAQRRAPPKKDGSSWVRPSPGLVRLVRAGSPLMLPVTLLAMACLLVMDHPLPAVAAFIMALLGYGLRNVLVQLAALRERDTLAALSCTDQLTGLPNRRRFDETLQREWNRADRAGRGLAVLMIDIDHFKQLNDGLGHQTGDNRLQAVGRALANCALRSDDLVARYGGEEFVAIVPSAGFADAVRMAEIMRDAVARLRLATPAPSGFVTISVGLGWVEVIDCEAPDQLLAVADAALYDAKRAGRDCVRQRQVDEPSLEFAGTH